MDGNSHTSGIKRLGIAVIGVALVAVIVAYSFWFGEPRWQGRRLSSWLEDLRYESLVIQTAAGFHAGREKNVIRLTLDQYATNSSPKAAATARSVRQRLGL